MAINHQHTGDAPPAHTLAGHPALYELAAQTAGWTSRAEQETARAELRAGAETILDWCARHGVIVATWAHLLEVLEDRVQAGVIRLSVAPWKDGAVGDECRVVARDAFRAYVALRRAERERAAAGLATCWDETDAALCCLDGTCAACTRADVIVAQERAVYGEAA